MNGYNGTLAILVADRLQLDPGLLRQAYCINPPDDTCTLGYCAQPDIAGPLVRVSAYIINLCLALLLWTSPQDAFRAFWPQLVAIYSVLAGLLVTLASGELTRFHTMAGAMLIGSPTTLSLWLTCARTLWTKHPGVRGNITKFVGCAGMIVAMFAWYTLVVTAASKSLPFSQDACDTLSTTMKYYPMALVFPPALFMLPFAFVVTLARSARKDVLSVTFAAHWKIVWESIDTEYPVTYAVITIFLPLACWVAFIEAGVLLASPEENHDWLSFGQIAAVFSAVPPLMEVIPRVIAFIRGFHLPAILSRPSSPDTDTGKEPLAAMIQVDVPQRNAQRVVQLLLGPGTTPRSLENVWLGHTRTRSLSF